MCTDDKAMRSVPHIKNRAAHTVELTSNVLSSIAEGDFAGMRVLETLDLTDNLITHIAASALKDCGSLVTFYISKNWLGDCRLAGTAANAGLPEQLFRNLTNLTYILANDNYLTGLPETILRGLVRLKKIDLVANCIRYHHPTVFAGLHSLTEYAVQLQQGFEKTWEKMTDTIVLPAGLFDDLPAFQHFYFGGHNNADGEVVITDGRMLAGAPNITEMWICCGIKDLFPHVFFKGLSKVHDIHVVLNDFTSLAPNMFADCEALRDLEMTNSGIIHVPAGTFGGKVGNIENVVMDGNRITMLRPGLFDSCTSLVKLSMKGNMIASIPSQFLRALPKIKDIELFNNVLDCPTAATTPASLNTSSCVCVIPPENDVRYKLVQDSASETFGPAVNSNTTTSTTAITTCESIFLPGSSKCTTDPRLDRSCSQGLCRSHCCAASVVSEEDNCPACGAKSGSCYRPLALKNGWAVKAKLDESTGWIGRINQGMLQSIRGPPLDFVGTMLLNVKHSDISTNASARSVVGPKFSYRLGWSANASVATVGERPPASLVKNSGTGVPSGADPGFIILDPQHGDVYAVPKDIGRYTAWLILTDRSGTATEEGLPAEFDEVIIKQWSFEVTEVRRLGLSSAWKPKAKAANMLAQYQVGVVYEVPEPNMPAKELFKNVAGGDANEVRYAFTVRLAQNASANSNSPTNRAAPLAEGKFFVSQTGEVSIKVATPERYTATLEAQDRVGIVTVREWTFDALEEDTKNATNGPNGQDCGGGLPIDVVPFDQNFTCDCNATKFLGDNCNIESPKAAPSAQDNTTLYAIGAVFGVMVLACVVIFLVIKFQHHQRSMLAMDFQQQLEQMKEDGQVDAEQISKGARVPRELKRSWLMMIDRLGQGQFGEVWKGLLKETGETAYSNSLEIIVAAKTVKEVENNNDDTVRNEGELMKEALLMAQVDPHRHLVSIIGVITRGRPKTLVLNYCEHGEMGTVLKKAAADGNAFDVCTKYRFMGEIAAGMGHLGKHNFIHRDLAARNVLLGSGMVCKVADFGLSRRVQTEDNTGDYYRSTSGVLPVRWTAPEGLTSQKFSSASDVWSFGIVCIEIFQDGIQPYVETTSNPAVMTLVTNGKTHPQPPACTDEVYALLQRCFSFEPNHRPAFAELIDFFRGVVLATPNTAPMPKGFPMPSAKHNADLQIYLNNSVHGGAVLDELQRSGALTLPDIYSTSEYDRLGVERKSSILKEKSIVGGLNGVQISAKLREATKELSQHASEYNKLFDVWRTDESLLRLKPVLVDAAAMITTGPYADMALLQPNPWEEDDIKVDSKRYLSRVIAVFSGSGSKYGVDIDPTADVVAACVGAMNHFGAAVEIIQGPPKQEQRIMEKARSYTSESSDGTDGSYNVVRDLGRLSLIISDISMVPDVVKALTDCQGFRMARTKNRLDPSYNADETAGYRDCQILVREPRGGWIVEIQVIPRPMFELKQGCGHAGYKKYRFILEACKRAKQRVAEAANNYAVVGGSDGTFAAFVQGARPAQEATASADGNYATNTSPVVPFDPHTVHTADGPYSVDAGTPYTRLFYTLCIVCSWICLYAPVL